MYDITLRTMNLLDFHIITLAVHKYSQGIIYSWLLFFFRVYHN